MTNDTPWQSPGGPDPQGEQSPYSATPPPAPAGWTPPPRPGLIPLRPLELGTILGATLRVLRRNPKPTFGLSLLITGITLVVTLLVVGVVSFFAISRTLNASEADIETLQAGSVAMIVLAALVPIGLSIVGTAILQGIVALEVARGTLGEKLTLGGLWRSAHGRIGALIGWAAIISAVIVVLFAILAGLVALLVAFGGTAGLVIGILLGIFGALAVAVLFAWIGTKVAFVPTVLMLERLPLRAAIARSWSLTKGYFWKTFGILLLVIVIINVVTSIVTTPLSILLGIGSSLLNPNGDETGLIVAGVVLYLVTIIVSVVLGAVAAVMQAATPALLYIDIRMRKEGLDLELSRFVESRQAGIEGQDPYRVGAATAGTPGASPWS